MITETFLSFPRNLKRVIVLVTDMIMLPFALWLSFSLRLGELYLPTVNTVYLFLAVPFIACPIFVRFGLYRAIIRYIGFLAMWSVIKAVTLYTLVWGVLVLLMATPGVPRSVLFINWLVTLILVGGSRATARWWLSGTFNMKIKDEGSKRVVIYGAGNAGRQIASALSGSSEFIPVAYIDDNKSFQGNYIQGLPVYGFDRLASLIDELSVTDILLAMPSISRSSRGKIISRLEPLSVHVTTLPGVDDLASGKIKVEDVREVGVRDILGREQVAPDTDLLEANIKGKSVLVTGAGGSIGSELCRQIIRLRPKSLVLYERNEAALYAIDIELTERLQRLSRDRDDTEIEITPILASVTNQGRLEMVCRAFGTQTIYHAAAYKHVPMVEKNPLEAVANNIIGTYNAARASISAQVETFVLVSTDKAVRPTNTMGATKRFAEIILQGLAANGESNTRFMMVRFGNVLESSGSVVPLFREQIRSGGSVTVTDPEITRFFMTIPEAAQLVIQAGAMGKGGDVFVLDMGEPVKILDLAKRMIHLSGYEVRDAEHPGGDIEIVFTGLRPGEKLYEELLIGENVQSTRHPLIMTADEDSLPMPQVEQFIQQFEQALETFDVEQCRALLMESVKGFHPQCDVADLVFGRKQKDFKIVEEADVLEYERS